MNMAKPQTQKATENIMVIRRNFAGIFDFFPFLTVNAVKHIHVLSTFLRRSKTWFFNGSLLSGKLPASEISPNVLFIRQYARMRAVVIRKAPTPQLPLHQ